MKWMTVAVLVGTLALVGCNKKPKEDVAKAAPPPPPLEAAPAPAPAPSTVVVAPAPAPAPAEAMATGKVYIVKAGDTLSKIAREQLGGINHLGALKAANPGINFDRLKVGQKINLP